MKKELTETEMRYKAEAFCIQAERCIADVKSKLETWGADTATAESIIEHLLKEKYVDQTRFCAAFVRDKYRFNQWGRAKIGQALRLKKIPADLIAAGMEEIDEQEYLSILSNLIRQKGKSVKARSEYERNAKLIRFAVSRGFELEDIFRFLKQPDCHEDFAD